MSTTTAHGLIWNVPRINIYDRQCGILFYSYFLYRINLHSWSCYKIRIEDFGSRTWDEMYRKQRPKVYCGLERSTTGSCFIKPRVYWNLFHPSVEEELYEKEKVWISRWEIPEEYYMRTNINVTSCMKHIFFSWASISWLWAKKYARIIEKVDLEIIDFLLWKVQKIQNVIL